MEAVFSFLYYAGLLILGLSILVVWHELGHFLPAKWFGMRVEKFYLFFDWPRKLFSFKKKDTEYGVGMLPLGGYVKISGIVDESMDTGFAQTPAQPWEFRAKPVWQRFIVMAGGVIMNVILGVFIFWMVKYTVGEYKIPISGMKYGLDVAPESFAEELGFKSYDQLLTFNGKPIQYLNEVSNPNILLEQDAYFEILRNGQKIRIDIPNGFLERFSEQKSKQSQVLLLPNTEPFVYVLENSPAGKAGLKDGDKILQINSTTINTFTDIRQAIHSRANQLVEIRYTRENQEFNTKAQLDSSAKLGIAQSDKAIPIETFNYSFFGAFVPGLSAAFSTITDNVKGLRKIVTGEVSAGKSMAGPVKIAKMIGKNFDNSGWLGFWTITGALSMVLAFMNILPIPALDGGHIVFLLIEGVTGKEPPLKVRMVAQQIGMVLLLALMVFVIINDIIN